MAIVATNDLIDGIRGRIGRTLMFRTLRNKTIVSTYTPPSKKQSEAQKANRNKFRDATDWAKITLRDPEQKAYYLRKAKKLGLPNAYTAAITDYMRKPSVNQQNRPKGLATFTIGKKDFSIKKTEIILTATDGSIETRSFLRNTSGECYVTLSETDLLKTIRWLVTDAIGTKEIIVRKTYN